MSVCIEHQQYETQYQQKSQQLTKRETLLKFSQAFCVKDEGHEITAHSRTIYSHLLKSWYMNHRQRKQLAKLDARLLADIGYTKKEARAEYSKRFWE